MTTNNHEPPAVGESADALMLHVLRETVRQQQQSLDSAAEVIVELRMKLDGALTARATEDEFFLAIQRNCAAEQNRLNALVRRLTQEQALLFAALRKVVTTWNLKPEYLATVAGMEEQYRAFKEAVELLAVFDAQNGKSGRPV